MKRPKDKLAESPKAAPTGKRGTANPPATAADARRFGRWEALIMLALLALVALVYWPVHGFDFINYDDPEYVSENLRVQAGLNLENLRWAFQTVYFENWHPVTWLSYMLDYHTFGLNAGAFHMVNVLFHALNTVLLFVVLNRMTGARWPSAFVAAVFAAHPLHVESVAWISERKDVLSSFFMLLTLWAYASYAERRRVWTYLLALLLFALGLMAKPMLVTLPFLFLLLDVWPLRRAWPSAEPPPAGGSAGFARVLRLLPGLLPEKIPFFVLSAVSSIVTLKAQHGARATSSSVPFAERITNAAVSYGRYLAKTLWPHKLAVYYPHPGWWPAWQIAGAFVLVAVLTVLVGRRWRNHPYLLIGWLWFLGTLVPVIGLVQVGGQSMADRYMYVPLIGLMVMLAWGAAALGRHWGFNRAGLMLAGAGSIILCVSISRAQVGLWNSSEALFEHALAVTGGSTVAHNNLGDALLGQSRTNEAMAHFSAAMGLDPEDFLAYGNVGNVLLGQGRTEEAKAKYQRGLELNAKNPELNHNMGLALAGQGKFSEAIGYYSAAVQSRTEYADAYLSMGNAWIGLRKFDNAISNYHTVLRFKPRFAPAEFNIGNALAQQGKDNEALPHYLEALRLQPTNAQAHANLAMALAHLGRGGEAVSHLTEASRLKPEEAQYHFDLASMLDAQKRTQEALGEYHEALRLKPNFVLALNNLAWILATHPDAAIRNGAEAVKCAEGACELTGRQQAFLMGTLAAAYAEAGRFSEAATTARKAVELAAAAGQKELAAKNEELLALYQNGKAYRSSR